MAKAEAAKKPHPKAKPTLIVVPASLIVQWEDEIASMTDQLTVYTYHGDARKRERSCSIDGILSKDHKVFQDGRRVVILTSITTLTLRHGQSAIREYQGSYKSRPKTRSVKSPVLDDCFGLVVIDEAHVLRNRNSQNTHMCQSLNAEFYLLLTATPFFNSLHDFKGYAELILQDGEINVSGPQCDALFKDNQLGTSEHRVLCHPTIIDEFIFGEGVSAQKAGIYMRKILVFCMLRRTIKSRIPFVDGSQIGESIPGLERKIVHCEFNGQEQVVYKQLQKKHRRNLFTKESSDSGTKLRWNNEKLRRLVLLCAWLGFRWIEGSLATDALPAAMRAIKRSTIVPIWQKSITDDTIFNRESSKDIYTEYPDTSPEHRTARLEWLLRGSPKMRAMLPIIRDELLLYGEKSIVWVSWPAEEVYVLA